MVKQAEKGILREMFIDEGKSISEIAKKLNTSYREIYDSLVAYNLMSPVDQKKGKKESKLDKIKREHDLTSDDMEDIKQELMEKKGLELCQEGKEIYLNKSSNMSGSAAPRLPWGIERRIKIGLVGDTHLGSKFQQLSLLKQAYTHMEDEGVQVVGNLGDLTDGSVSMHKGFLHQLFLHTFQDQLEYVVANYPKTSLKTYVTPGNHDESFFKSDAGNIVKMICDRREDMNYLAPGDANFEAEDGKVLISLIHPTGGMPYSKSYRSQKLCEGIVNNILNEYRTVGNLNKLPSILAVGHLHTFNYFVDSGMQVIMTPSFQGQTPYLRSKGLTSTVGYLILDLGMDEHNNIIEVVPRLFDLTAKQIEKDY